MSHPLSNDNSNSSNKKKKNFICIAPSCTRNAAQMRNSNQKDKIKMSAVSHSLHAGDTQYNCGERT